MGNSKKPAPLAFKPDLEEAAKRWEAYQAGEIIDRPVVCVTAPREGKKKPASGGRGYHDRVHGDMGEILENALLSAEATFWGGESVPSYFPSFGPDEIAVFCGGTLAWSDESPNTNWSIPFVKDWKQALPLQLHQDDPLWQRLLEFYRKGVECMAGKMLLAPPDLHTNMDLLAAARGPQPLCFDVLDEPEMIDRAMVDARAVFRELWAAVVEAGRMDELGYSHGMYSMDGAAVLQCDFSCMISPEMFQRWVLPALEEEAEIVRNAMYHWDGPDALVHTDALLASAGLHTFSYVPGSGRGSHIDYVDLFKRVQAGGKAVAVGGTPEEIKTMHRELRPEKTCYHTGVGSEREAEELLDWFVKNT